MKVKRKVFQLVFIMDNAVFEHNPREEVVRILKEAANKVESGYNSGKVMDINGNSIGTFGTKGWVI